MHNVDIEKIISLSEQAAQAVLMIYRQPSFDVTLKMDKSFLTQADIASHAIICEELQRLYPQIPVISEESTTFHDHEIRKNWHTFFLVDPLDGTKEFIERNDEFTINIALVQHNIPVLGMILAPALGVIYFAEKDQGAYKRQNSQTYRLPILSQQTQDKVRIVISRSHACAKTKEFIASFQQPTATVAAGSALKFGLVAEGAADIYPRFTPTMEWDTAAGHVIVMEAGKKLTTWNGDRLNYNKKDLTNSGFIVR